MTNAKQLLAAAKAIQADVDACGLGPRKHDAKEASMSGSNRIYLQLLDENGEPSSWATWCENRIHDTDVEYVTADRLRLLEAVAKAARADALRRRDDMGYGSMTLAECADVVPVSPRWRLVLKALAALEALDEREQP